MDSIVIMKGEKRYCAVSFANDPAVAAGGPLGGTPTAAVLAKRGRADAELVVSTPAAPAISGSQVRFWVDATGEDVARGRYVARASATVGQETVWAEVPLLIQ